MNTNLPEQIIPDIIPTEKKPLDPQIEMEEIDDEEFAGFFVI